MPNDPAQTTNRPRFYGSRDIGPMPNERDWNPLAAAAARQEEFRRSLRIVWNCQDGHQHETAEAAAKCIAESFDDVDGDWAE